MELSLAQALRISSSAAIAFIGSGGKSTALFKLARELSAPVLVTATTHLGTRQTGLADKHIATEAVSIVEIDVDFPGLLLVTGHQEGDRTRPVNDHLLNELHQYCKNRGIPILIEADGSRQKPLKAWAEHEPPIPDFVDSVVQVMGMSGVGKPLSEEHVHRPELFSKLTGLQMGEIVTAKSLVEVLSHPANGMRNSPANSRKVLLLNQAEDVGTQSVARSMLPSLLPNYSSVVIASLLHEKVYAVHERMAGIILAAGQGKRFGTPKQLLEWKGQPFIRTVAKTAIAAGLSPVIIVTGSNAEQVESAVQELDVTVVRNAHWESGQGSSIREGLQTLTSDPLPTGKGCGGCIFLLADQPQVNTTIIHALKEKHAQGLYSIVAPLIADQRGNPVLFDRMTFPDLLSIEGDVGGRAIFHKHRVEYLPWHDESLLLDVDTPEQYKKLISNKAL